MSDNDREPIDTALEPDLDRLDTVSVWVCRYGHTLPVRKVFTGPKLSLEVLAPVDLEFLCPIWQCGRPMFEEPALEWIVGRR